MRAQELLRAEERRVTAYLHSISLPKVFRICLEEAFIAHSEQLFTALKVVLFELYDNSQARTVLSAISVIFTILLLLLNFLRQFYFV